jgi:hypothetical protein
VSNTLTIFGQILRRNAPLFLVYVALFVLVRAWFVPGLIAGEDFATSGWDGKALLQHDFPWPDSWDPSLNMGAQGDPYMVAYPLLVVAGLLTKLGIDWTVIERLLWLFPLFVLLPLAPYVLALRLTKSRWAATAGALVFSINTWTVGLIERGHIPSLIAYALLPLVIYAARSAMQNGSRRSTVWLGALVLVQGMYDIRYAYLTVIALAVLWFVEAAANPQAFLRMLAVRRIGLFFGVLVVGNLYWIVPSLFTSMGLPPGYNTAREFSLDNAGLDVLHSFSLFYAHYHHIVSTDGFYVDPVEWSFTLIGFLGVCGLLLRASRPIVRALALLWLFGAIFASGSTSIFGSLNQWVFLHVPGMGAFRDATKLMSLSNMAAAMGIALLVEAIPGISFRSFKVSRSAAGLAAAFLFYGFYVYALRDAYNPLRLSNFAAVELTQNDRKLLDYIDRAPPGRVLFFPGIPPGYRFGTQHPFMLAGELALSSWPGGLYSLNPPQSKNIFGFYASPLANALLCETGVRYVALITDEKYEYFSPWQFNVQRSESHQFLDSRRWLQPVSFGAPAGPENRTPFLYRLRNCDSDPDRLAFIARYPAVFHGSSAFVESLAGSIFWRKDPAILIGGEQRSLAAYDALSNFITAPVVIDPADQASFALGLDAQQNLLAEGARHIAYQPAPYHAYAFDRNAQAQLTGVPIPPGLIKQTFLTPGGSAGIQAAITPQYAPDREIARSTRLVARLAPQNKPPPQLVDPAGFLADPGPGTFPTDSPADWIQIAQSGAEFSVVNPLLGPVIADISIPGAATTQGVGDAYGVTVSGQQSWALALPVVLYRFGLAVPNTIHGVLLQPGSNSLRITPSNRAAPSNPTLSDLVLDPKLTISNVEEAGAQQASGPLVVAVAAGTDGLKLSARATQSTAYAAKARFRLMSNLALSLSSRPQIQVRYHAPPDPLNFDIALGINGPSGPAEYVVNLPRSESAYTIDAFTDIQKTLDAQLQQERERHRDDYEWLRGAASVPHKEASEYTLNYADLLVVRPPVSVFVGAAGTFRSATLLASASALSAAAKDYVAQVNFSRSSAPKDVVAQNATLNATVRSPTSLVLTAALQRSSQEMAPSQIHVNDTATFTLSNGSVISGVVTGESGGTIVVQNGPNSTGIREDSIATVSHVIPNGQQILSFTTPFDVPADASNVEFSVLADPILTMKFVLEVVDRATGKRYALFPQDRALNAAQVEAIPADWMQTDPDEPRIAPLDSGPPVDAAAARAGLAQRTFYDLPLHEIFESELPQASRPQVIGLRFTFASTSVNTISAHNVNVEISTLAATRAHRVTTGDAVPVFHDAALQLDGKTVRLRAGPPIDVGATPGRLAYATVTLAPGKHLLTADERSARTVQWGLISVGNPARSTATQVTQEQSPSYSERWGTLATDGGLLVMPTTYAGPWRLALVPAAFTPSGNAVMDYIRLRSAFVPQDLHVRVNGGLNGWLVPAIHGRAVFIYETTFFSTVGGLLELLVIAIWILVARRRRTLYQ